MGMSRASACLRMLARSNFQCHFRSIILRTSSDASYHPVMEMRNFLTCVHAHIPRQTDDMKAADSVKERKAEREKKKDEVTSRMLISPHVLQLQS